MSNLPFAEWTSVVGGRRITAAPLDRPTHYVHILELTDESAPQAIKSEATARPAPPPPKPLSSIPILAK